MNRYHIGALHQGTGDINIGESYVGYPEDQHVPPAQPPRPPRAADVGVLTVLTEEMRAVVDVFRCAARYETAVAPGGARVHRAAFPAVGGGEVRAVAMQTLDRGPSSAALAYHRIRQLYAPPIVLLVGIAGGISDRIDIGDVAISDQVIYYDARRVTPKGTVRRGQDQATAAPLRHRVNDFFLAYGGTVPLDGHRSVRVLRGPIGSGDAVVTDADSDIRQFLLAYNEKTLAVETEAAGVARAFVEEPDHDDVLRGWLTVRGISDRADRAKGHDRHELAARHAATVLAHLLPFLKFPE